jgi:hypothetical protein
VIRVDREWSYDIRAHVRYTEIPLWTTAQDRQGSYQSDHHWLHKLAPGKEYPTEFSCVEYDSKILDILKTLPSGQRAAAPSASDTNSVDANASGGKVKDSH